MDLAFPAVLRVFELSPFDFCKLIENVVRLESGVFPPSSLLSLDSQLYAHHLFVLQLPRVMVKHLGKIEEQILESFAWEEGSPVYSLLQQQQQQQQQPAVRGMRGVKES